MDPTQPGLIRGGAPEVSRSTRTLPADLLAQAVRRLYIMALLYAFIYFMAGQLPNLLAGPVQYFSGNRWIPSTLSILTALAVAGVARWSRISDTAKLRLGLVFQVISSYGIAIAQYRGISEPLQYANGRIGFGLSYAAVWVLLYVVTVPTQPRRASIAAALALSSVPVVLAVAPLVGWSPVQIPREKFFVVAVFPYLLTWIMCAVGARVVYGLGAAVREARELGSYRLAEKLAMGGMGEVWRAEHRLLARPAAIKLVRPELLGAADSESRRVALKRFEREAQTTASLQSPHTVQLYDYGVEADGTFYHVMELLEGWDLEALIERFGPQPPGRVIRVLRQVLNSLGEAHEAGLIHRDIKPANIYLTRLARTTDFVKVLDFGLVKPERAPQSERLTAEHGTGGTPAFMSPEQASGEQDLDGRSDLYSVACVGYWMLTGKLVFEGRTAMEIMVKHIGEQPVPPSRRAEQPVSAELDAIIMQCLAKDRAQRPPSADELRARLKKLPESNEWTEERSRRWWDMHRPSRPVSPQT